MRKFALIVVIMLTLFSCKKHVPEARESLVAAPPCITMAGYDSLSTIALKAAWLRDHGAEVCPNLLNDAEKTHLVVDTTVVPYPDAKTYIMQWQTLDSLVGNYMYQKYVSFEVDSDRSITNVVLVPEYKDNGLCYSIPLFRSIVDLYQLSPTSEFEFISAKVGPNETIAIRFKDNSTGDVIYYDYTIEPK